jgi:anti-sigma regulatory factor (Ser/Thr protein kinase)/biotin operon repressor
LVDKEATLIDKEKIQKQALLRIAKDGRGVAAYLALKFGLSRQAVHKHLQAMVQGGLISAEGSTRAHSYRLATLKQANDTYKRQGLSEDKVWAQLVLPVLRDLPENARDIWHYGVTEMVNNAIDHSGSNKIEVEVRRNALYTDAFIFDQGIGIFVKIQKALELYDPRDAILELAKGKLTTDPARHSGEGIFFASKAFDDFTIYSRRLLYSHNIDHPLDALIDHGEEWDGTLVRMRLANDSPLILKKVFDDYAAPEEYTFAKTLVPVRLAQYEGEKLVSRSQAKRLTLRFEKFKHVVLDFSGVSEIGQAFADELFRVFAKAHPAVELTATHMTKAVEQMVKRARASLKDPS